LNLKPDLGMLRQIQSFLPTLGKCARVPLNKGIGIGGK